MIAVTCHRCGSSNLRKNGRTPTGQQKFHCKDCNLYGVLDRKDAERKLREQAAQNLLLERLSQRDIARTLHMSRRKEAQLIKKALTPLSDTIIPLTERPILEIDELWSFVGHKDNQVWVWVALERQTRRIVGFAVGDRSEATCRKLWQSLPTDYRKRAICYTDFWAAYATVIPSKRHRAVGKETGETARIERFNNTLRQRCANLVRKTLSFSRDVYLHELRLRIFIDHYNRRLQRYRPAGISLMETTTGWICRIRLTASAFMPLSKSRIA